MTAARDRVRAKFLQFSVAGLAMFTLGADEPGCGGPDYGKVSDVRIYYGGSLQFDTRVDNHVTHGWRKIDMYGKFFSPTIGLGAGELTALGPRELFVFNRDVAMPTTNTAGKFFDDYVVASAIAGFRAELTVPVLSARFVDHGSCREFFPFLNMGSGLFEVLRDAIKADFDKQIRDGGATPIFRAGQLQASFVRTGEVDTALADGFSLAFWFTGEVPTIVVPDVEIAFGSNFAFFLEEGFVALRSVRTTVNVFHPKGFDAAAGVSGRVHNTLTKVLPGRLRTFALYGTPDGKISPAARNTFINCEAQPANFCAAPPQRKKFAALVAGSAKIPVTDAELLVSALPAQDFTCRKFVPDVDDQALPGEYDRCWWRPSFKRINVTPAGIEPVWSNAAEPEAPDLRFVRAVSPNRRIDCTVVRPPSVPQTSGVAGLTEGDLAGLRDRLDH